MTLRLYGIPLGTPFLPALARGVLAELGAGEALARTTILLPTQRSARALQAAFLDTARAPALLLPRMRALAGLSTEEADELSLPALLELPPAVEAMTRQAALAGLVAAHRPVRPGGRDGRREPLAAAQAWALAGELASLLDEVALEEREEIPLDPASYAELWLARLDALAPEALAEHWQVTTGFLRAVARGWRDWLAARGLLDIGLRRLLALRAQRAAWASEPPAHAVIAAGIGAGGTIPAAAALLRLIARDLPQGAVVVPREDAASAGIAEEVMQAAPTHPFAGQRRLLRALGATPAEVLDWPGCEAVAPSPRAGLLGTALLPHPSLEPWTRPAPQGFAAALDGLSLLEAADAQAEAAGIALAMRGCLAMPGARVALVTPDRDLACRVAAELPRHGLAADDSAGRPLDGVPAGAFLRLLAEAVADGFAPVPLLALLKHPLCRAGHEAPEWLAAVSALELAALRGPRPAPGLAGIRERAARRPRLLAGAALALDGIERCLSGFALTAPGEPRAPADLLERHLAAAEALCATPSLPGGLRLYANEEGEPLARHLAAMAQGFAELPPCAAREYPALFAAALAGGTARCLRVTRGRDALASPAVEILGLLEARLLDFDCVILGALDESVWPLAAESGPWMSRPMRQQFGLPEPEMRIGRVAADFVLAACSARQAVLSRAARRGGAPTVPARWLTRLATLLRGQAGHEGRGLALPASQAAAWAAGLDLPAGEPRPAPRPAPAPPAAARPRRLTVSDIATLLSDPYAFYARRVLGLAALDPLDADPGASGFGEVVHEAMRRFLGGLPQGAFPGEAVATALWQAAAETALAEERPTPALAAIWRPRLARIGGHVAALEAAERGGLRRTLCEAQARLVLARPGGEVSLEGRADRLDILADGTLRIIDYKTGTVPSREAVRAGTAPQLPVEAWMAEHAAFASVPAAPVTRLAYWHLTGGEPPGGVSELGAGKTPLDIGVAQTEARRAVERLADRFLLGTAPFLARPHPRRDQPHDYDHLSREAEWAAGGES